MILPVSETASYTYEAPTTSLFYRHCAGPMCDWLVGFVPAAVHPDHLTFAGLLNAFAAVIALRYSCVLAVVFWVSYATFDNLDGKHARRTGQSSVRGEYLDHVADSATCAMLVYLLSYGFLDYVARASLLISLATQVPFLLACWYYYNTGKILLGSTRMDTRYGPLVTVDEMNYLAVPALLLGHPLFVYADLLPWGWTLGELCMIVAIVGTCVESVDVMAQITTANPLSEPQQIKIFASTLTYIGAVSICKLSPAVTLPVFVWFCASLIYPNCAAKIDPKRLKHTNVVLPGVGILLLAISSVVLAQHMVAVRVIACLLASAVVFLDIRSLRA